MDQDEEAEDKEDEHAAKLIYRSLFQLRGYGLFELVRESFFVHL